MKHIDNEVEMCDECWNKAITENKPRVRYDERNEWFDPQELENRSKFIEKL